MPKGRTKPGVPGSGQGPGIPPDPNAPTLQAWADSKGEHGQLIVLLMEPTEGKLPNNPFILSRTIKEAVGTFDSAYRDQAKNLVIRVRSEKKARKLLGITELIDGTTKVKVSEHPKLNRSRCIVTCHSVNELTDKELEEELEDQGVIGVHRFAKKGVKTNTMVVTVKGTVPPKEIAFGYEVCRTRPYKDSPLQCFRCFSFGHTKARCTSEKETCRNCSEEHPINKDDAGRTICAKPAKCKNCDGNHSPAVRACPRYIEEEKILEIRARNDVSPREARRLYDEEKAAANNSYAAAAKSGTQHQEARAEQAKLRKELEETKKAIKAQVEEAKQALQAELDVTKAALAQAKQEIHRLKASAKIADEANRKRKVSESGSRSDESDSSEGPIAHRQDDELLRHPKLQTRKDGSTAQPSAHSSADRSVVLSKTKPNAPKINDDDTTTTTTTTTKTSTKNSTKKKKKTKSKKPKNGDLDGEDTDQHSEMEQ